MINKKEIMKIQKKVMSKFKQHKKLFKSAKKSLKSKRVVTTIALVAVLVILAVSFNLNRFLVGGNKVVATVNENEITAKELDKGYDFFFFLAGYPDSYRQVITKESYLDQMINEKILLQEAVKNRISILDSEVEVELDALISRSPVSKSEFEVQLNEAGFNMKDLFDYYKRQMVLKSLLDEQFTDIQVSDTEAKVYYDENIETFSAVEGQIKLRHILVETEEEAEIVLDSLKKGKNFAILAIEESIGPTSVKGGDLGFVSEGQMVPEFEEAAFDLNVNQISGVVQTQFGYHIIKREPSIVTFKDAKEDIVEMIDIEKQQEVLKDYLDELKSDADIVNSLSTKVVDSVDVIENTEDTCYSSKMTSDTVIFYHADWCGYCNKMKPIVSELQAEGYKFYLAETSNKEETAIVTSCFSDVIQGGIPQFICAGNKEYKMGAMSKDVLKAFADSCQ